MRCDLHVHSWYSGRTDVPVLEHLGRESYSDPLDVYARAMCRGMDLVTLTDHDTVEGALGLCHLPNSFVSEEVTVLLANKRQLHVNVFDITEAQHTSIQARRADPESLFAFLAEQNIPAAANHLFSALTGARETADLCLPLGRVPLVEALNGSMPVGHNEFASRVGRAAGMAPIGGSDSHSLAHVARAFTTVVGAHTKREFLDGLRRGLTVPSGRSGSYARLTDEVTRIFAAGYLSAAREARAGTASGVRVAACALMAPLLPLIPLFTVAVYARELAFGAWHFQALQRTFAWPTRSMARPTVAAQPVASLEEAA
jgi:predicted metal-dependent phosphoesterase TrpH